MGARPADVPGFPEAVCKLTSLPYQTVPFLYLKAGKRCSLRRMGSDGYFQISGAYGRWRRPSTDPL